MKQNVGGNEQLTAFAGILLVVFLAVEGATLLNLRALLTVHAFIGMFLLPIVALRRGCRRRNALRRRPPAGQAVGAGGFDSR